MFSKKMRMMVGVGITSLMFQSLTWGATFSYCYLELPSNGSYKDVPVTYANYNNGRLNDGTTVMGPQESWTILNTMVGVGMDVAKPFWFIARLDTPVTVSTVSLYYYVVSNIYAPKQMDISFSKDGVNFSDVSTLTGFDSTPSSNQYGEGRFITFSLENLVGAQDARYVKIVLPFPDGSPAGWIFLSEVVFTPIATSATTLFTSDFVGTQDDPISSLSDWSVVLGQTGTTQTIDNNMGKLYGDGTGWRYSVIRADKSEGDAYNFQPISTTGNRFEHTVNSVTTTDTTYALMHRAWLVPQSVAANSGFNVIGERIMLDMLWNRSNNVTNLYLRFINSETTNTNSGVAACTMTTSVDLDAGDHIRLALEVRDGGGSDVRIAFKRYIASTGTWGVWTTSDWFDPSNSGFSTNAFDLNWKDRWINNTYYNIESNCRNNGTILFPSTTWIDDVIVMGDVVESAEMPVLSPDGGYIAEGQKVMITTTTTGVQIRYTLDGSTPTQSSSLYTDGVLVEPGQTLSARTYATNYTPSPVKTSSYKFFNGPATISRIDGSVKVDGKLSEWQASEFVALNKNYSGASPITEAAYAVRWDGTTNQFYVAVKVNDPTHNFLDMYEDYNLQDGVEIYLHTTGGLPYEYTLTQNTAQQYVVGLKQARSGTDPTAHVWKTFAGDYPISDEQAQQVGFQAAGVEEKDELGNPTGWLFYEVKMTAYEWLAETGTILSPLSVGDNVGVDVVACDKWTSGFGMKSENMLAGKYDNWRQIGVHKLVLHPADFNADGKLGAGDIDLLFVQIKNGMDDSDFDLNADTFVNQADMDVMVLELVNSHYGDANCDGAVDVGDLGILAANYGGSGKTWSMGDFNGDGAVDVGDLGILAANYGSSNFSTDCAMAFGTAVMDDSKNAESTSSSVCSGVGLPLLAGLALMGLMLVKLEE